MKRHILALTILASVAFGLHLISEWAPILVLILGICLGLLGDQLVNAEKKADGPKSGTGTVFVIYGCLAITAGVAGLSLDGNLWMLVFTGLFVAISAMAIESQGTLPTDKVCLRDFLRVAVAISLPVAGLVIATAKPMNLVTGLLVIGFGSVLGFLIAPLNLTRPARRRTVVIYVTKRRSYQPGAHYDEDH